MSSQPIMIIGGGPAGLTAAYELAKRGRRAIVLERDSKVGGIARTEVYKGNRFDIGGHRFFTKVPEVEALWKEVLAEDFIRVQRLSRIFYQGQFYSYPLEIMNALGNLGMYESARMVISFFKWKLRPHPQEETFDQWVMNRFGGRLYARFFKTYTEKVWGIPCHKIQADWAAQRIRGLSLWKAITNALFGGGDVTTLIKAFDYPRLGPGMMWERFQEEIEQRDGAVQLNCDVIRLVRTGYRINHIVARQDGQTITYAGDSFLSSMPLSALIARLDPPAPAEVLEAAHGLTYRDFIIVGLIISQTDLFPDNWIYIHSPDVKVGRIQNFGNWSPAMVADPATSSLGMEYFCTVGDALWEMTDPELKDLARSEIEILGLARADQVGDAVVIRQRKAYPVYDGTYRQHLAVIKRYLQQFENLQTLGRNGMHRYNNQDHSMLTAMLAVENIFGKRHDLWNVNTERSYYETFQTGR